MPDAGWSWPVLLAWSPLLAVFRLHGADRWKRRFMWGWLMGFGYQAVTFRWVHWTMAEMTNLPPAATITGMVLFWAWHGLNCAMFGALVEPVRRTAEGRLAGSGPVAIGVLWVTIEWAFPYIFPWTLGHAFWDVPALASIQALAGAPGISFVIVTLAAWAADHWLRSVRGVDRPTGRRAALWTASTVAPLVLFGAIWSITIDSTEPRRTLNVGVIQANYTIEEKKNPTYRVRMGLFSRLQNLLRGLEPGQFDLVVGSEGSFPMFWKLDADTAPIADADGMVSSGMWATRKLQGLLKKHVAAPAIMGGLRRDANKKVRNAAVHLGADGRIVDHYDKNILVPFSEYMPGRDWFPELENAVKGISNFYGGDTPCRFEAAGEVVACGICYEHIFADYSRDSANDSTVMANLTIDTWFGDGPAPWFHLMLHSSRAVELGTPLIRSALTGISAVVDIDGTLLSSLGLHEAGVLAAEVPLRDLTPPYRMVGPLFRHLCVALALALLLAAWLRRRREKRQA